MKNYLDIILSFAAIAGMFAGIIWRLALIKAKLEREIDEVKDTLDEKLLRLDKDLRIHLTEYGAKKEFLDYHLNALNEKIDHKFSRCWSEIRQNQAYLSKHGFIPREHQE